MQDKMNNEKIGRPILNLLHLQRGMSIEGHALDSEQAEGPIDSLDSEQVRYSNSPQSSSFIGTYAVRKKSWGRQASVRKSFQAMVHAQVPGAFKAVIYVDITEI